MATTVGANKRTVVHKDSGGTVSFMPDVCKTPQPSGPPIPILYPNTAMSTDADKGAKTVLVEGNPTLLQGSTFKESTGDEAGSAGGVTSGKTKGAAEFISYSFNVFAEGKGVARYGDLMLGNKGSAVNTPPDPVQQDPMPAAKGVAPGELMADKIELTVRHGGKRARRRPVRPDNAGGQAGRGKDRRFRNDQGGREHHRNRADRLPRPVRHHRRDQGLTA